MLAILAIYLFAWFSPALSLAGTNLDNVPKTDDVTKDLNIDKKVDELWKEFKVDFNKQYSDATEEAKRLSIFKDNVLNMTLHNLEYAKGGETYEMGINQFSDQTEEEYNGSLGYVEPKSESSGFYATPSPMLEDSSCNPMPSAVDWTSKGYVNPVKDQGSCGSCWSFSATGALEGQHFKKTGQLVSLSQQNLVDCSRPQGYYGCNGGYMSAAFQYVIDNKGIDTDASYPYTGSNGNCKFNSTTIGATATGYRRVQKGNETALKRAVACIGPISVAIDASRYTFKSYQSGIYNDPACNPNNLNHAVLAVGYGTQNGLDYWLVKNSWGTNWGEKGYIKLARNKRNVCGVANLASYPTV